MENMEEIKAISMVPLVIMPLEEEVERSYPRLGDHPRGLPTQGEVHLPLLLYCPIPFFEEDTREGMVMHPIV